MSAAEELPPEALFAELSKPSPPIRMSRPRPIMVLHELKSTAAAAAEIHRVIFIGIFDTPIYGRCKRILSTLFNNLEYGKNRPCFPGLQFFHTAASIGILVAHHSRKEALAERGFRRAE